jgi:hypothetical protein
VAANFLKVIRARLRERNQTQETLPQETQTLAEELVTKMESNLYAIEK